MTAETQILHDHPVDRAFRPGFVPGKVAIYALLIVRAVICLFPIHGTISTSFKSTPDVMQGNPGPWA